jgi:hypothetical protein
LPGVTIDLVDGADPQDASAPPNFGWQVTAEPLMDDERLCLISESSSDLARALADARPADHGD